jgi:hypothetical protein
VSIRTAIAVIIVTLAGTTALGPTQAMAESHGTNRPVEGQASGIVAINLSTLQFSADMTVELSHFGNGSAYFEAPFELTPDRTRTRATGPFNIVGANGDEVTGTFTLAGPAPSPTAHEAEVEMTITAGTGRFEGASGTLWTTPTLTPFQLPSPESPLLLETAESVVSGHVNY